MDPNGQLRIHFTLTIFFAKIVRQTTGFIKFDIQIISFANFFSLKSRRLGLRSS